MRIFTDSPLPSSSQIQLPLQVPYLANFVNFVFLTHQVQIVLPTDSWMWGLPMEHDLPPRSNVFKENWLSSQESPATNSSSARSGALCCLPSPCWASVRPCARCHTAVSLSSYVHMPCCAWQTVSLWSPTVSGSHTLPGPSVVPESGGRERNSGVPLKDEHFTLMLCLTSCSFCDLCSFWGRVSRSQDEPRIPDFAASTSWVTGLEAWPTTSSSQI